MVVSSSCSMAFTVVRPAGSLMVCICCTTYWVVVITS